jgi:hypothetical protein
MAALVVVSRLPNTKMPKLPIPWGRLHLILGATALVLVFIQYLIGDEVGGPGGSLKLERRLGVFLGLIAAAGLAYGGFRKSKEPEAAPGIIP